MIAIILLMFPAGSGQGCRDVRASLPYRQISRGAFMSHIIELEKAETREEVEKSSSEEIGAASKDGSHREEPHSATIIIVPDIYYTWQFFSQEESDALYKAVSNSTDWKHQHIVVMSKSVLQPRLTATQGDEGTSTGYNRKSSPTPGCHPCRSLWRV